jgi:hypothetical protein
MTDAEWIPIADAVELVRAGMEQQARVKFEGEPPPSQVRRWHQEHKEMARSLIWKFWQSDKLWLRATTVRIKSADEDEPTTCAGGDVTYQDWGDWSVDFIGVDWREPPPEYPSSCRFSIDQCWEWSSDGSLTIITDRKTLRKLPADEVIAFKEATGIEVSLLDLQHVFKPILSVGSDEPNVSKPLSQAAVDEAAVRLADGVSSEDEVCTRVASQLGTAPTQAQWRSAWSKVSPDRKLPRGRRSH